MKKTLIALAVAASAVVSGSAMAWTPSGTSGSINIGGTLTPADKVTPWEVKTGSITTGLDASVKKGETSITIPVSKAIPVLGIRTQNNGTFLGAAGITPQINYGQAVNIDGFTDGTTQLTLDVTNDGTNKIGTMTVDFFAGAEISQTDTHGGSENYKYSAYAADAGKAFFGGVAKDEAGVATDIVSKLNSIDPEFSANYTDQGRPTYVNNYNQTDFSQEKFRYSAFYGSGIDAGKAILITLDSPVADNTPIVWKASLPITVSYQ
ncbi:hypothetical protein FLC03_13315 [Salmonella enterica]|nr:hypothetical protein [Salmonella enterica]ECO5858365.1 hypothetical protein [Salmonella enterica]